MLHTSQEEASKRIKIKSVSNDDFESRPFDIASSIPNTDEAAKLSHGELYQGYFNNNVASIYAAESGNSDNSLNLSGMLVEVTILKELSHDNIPDYKTAWIKQISSSSYRLFIAIESISLGTLKDAMSKYDITWNLQIQFTEDISSALNYMHDKGYLHRNLVSSNILISEDFKAYLFGFSRVCHENSSERNNRNSCDPEDPTHDLSPHENYTKMTDIFGVGVLMMMMMLSEDNLKDNIPEELQTIAAQCAHQQPGFRPTASELNTNLKKTKDKKVLDKNSSTTNNNTNNNNINDTINDDISSDTVNFAPFAKDKTVSSETIETTQVETTPISKPSIITSSSDASISVRLQEVEHAIEHLGEEASMHYEVQDKILAHINTGLNNNANNFDPTLIINRLSNIEKEIALQNKAIVKIESLLGPIEKRLGEIPKIIPQVEQLIAPLTMQLSAIRSELLNVQINTVNNTVSASPSTIVSNNEQQQQQPTRNPSVHIANAFLGVVEKCDEAMSPEPAHQSELDQSSSSPGNIDIPAVYHSDRVSQSETSTLPKTVVPFTGGRGPSIHISNYDNMSPLTSPGTMGSTTNSNWRNQTGPSRNIGNSMGAIFSAVTTTGSNETNTNTSNASSSSRVPTPVYSDHIQAISIAAAVRRNSYNSIHNPEIPGGSPTSKVSLQATDTSSTRQSISEKLHKDFKDNGGGRYSENAKDHIIYKPPSHIYGNHMVHDLDSHAGHHHHHIPHYAQNTVSNRGRRQSFLTSSHQSDREIMNPYKELKKEGVDVGKKSQPRNKFAPRTFPSKTAQIDRNDGKSVNTLSPPGSPNKTSGQGTFNRQRRMSLLHFTNAAETASFLK